MRGAKAKALRRLAKNTGLPDRAYGVKPVKAKVINPETKETVEYDEHVLVLAPSKRAFVKHFAKRKVGRAPIVGLQRAARRAAAGAEIIPIEPENNKT